MTGINNKKTAIDFFCTSCHLLLIPGDNYFFCSSCNKKYPVKEGVSDFRGNNEYWCNVSAEKMHILNGLALKTGDWLKAAEAVIPEYLGHFNKFDRADGQFLWPLDSNSRVLDAGAMWGGLSVPLSQYCKEVIALDKTIETLQFLNIRCAQSKIENIITVAAVLGRLPFGDNYFDCVVLNGVLEWVGIDEEIILEKHWGKKRDKSSGYAKTPYQMQLDVLKEIQRVLRPGGCFCLAIENRFGYPYFIGQPDEHVNIKFVSLLPRFLANFITKLRTNTEYRTYTYSAKGLRKMSQKAGFNNNVFYGVFPHYIAPNFILPLAWVNRWFKKVVKPLQWYKKIILFSLLPPWRSFFVPSFMVLCSKEKSIDRPRIVTALIKTGLISGSSINVDVIKCVSRCGNHLTVHFMVYSDKTADPLFFCKVSRDKTQPGILKDEFFNLELVSKVLEMSPLSRSIPEVLFFGEIDKIILLVTKYKSGKIEELDPNRYFSPHRLVNKVSSLVDKSIEYLVNFQKLSTTGQVDAKTYLQDISKSARERLKTGNILSVDIIEGLNNFDLEIAKMGQFNILLCGVHGDFNLCNLKLIDSKMHVFDWELFSAKGSPVFDLSNLLLNIFLINYDYKMGSRSAGEILEEPLAKEFLRNKLSYYNRLSGIPKDLLYLIGPISVIEHYLREYPYYRNPDSYPLRKRKTLESLINWRIDL